jgi:hypothetical protein
LKITLTVPENARAGETVVGFDEGGNPYGFLVAETDADGKVARLVSLFHVQGPRIHPVFKST